MTVGKSILLWVISFILTLAIAYFQRSTGPTYPVSGEIVKDDMKVEYVLPRSHGGPGDQMVYIKAPDRGITGYMRYRRYKSYDDWTTLRLERKGDSLIARIPHQPPAGKVMYDISIMFPAGDMHKLWPEPVIIRFKGAVPAWALIPHIIFMFGAMLMSTRTGLEAAFGGRRVMPYMIITLTGLFLGGLVFGPIVQKYAFGVFWSGWPFGHDLTDNKTLVAFIFWAVAFFRMKKYPQKRGWAIVAAIILLAVFIIPHSVLGSELDYTEMQNRQSAELL
jgi:hypothetical protein